MPRWSGVGCVVLGLCVACAGDARDPSPPGRGEPSRLGASNGVGGTASDTYAGVGGGFSALHREVAEACPNEHRDDFCFVDADCHTGGPCLCSGQEQGYRWNICLDGNCRTDADCGGDLRCSPSPSGCGGIRGYFCRTPEDGCVDDTDCDELTPQCTYHPDRRLWVCGTQNLQCGEE